MRDSFQFKLMDGLLIVSSALFYSVYHQSINDEQTWYIILEEKQNLKRKSKALRTNVHPSVFFLSINANYQTLYKEIVIYSC
jgi:hypothetical protein